MNFLDVFNPIISGVTSLAQVGLGVGNLVQNNKISQDNLQFQQEQLEYQKALQQQIFEREDTAYQRTVNDMRSIGLSPLNMTNQNNAGSVVSTSAPQRQTQSTTDAINSFNNAFNNIASMQQTLSTIKNAEKQNQLLQTEIDANNIDNVSRRFRNLAEIRNILSETDLRNKDIASFDVLLEDSLLNSASLRVSRESENSLRKSEEALNKELTTRERDYNSLHSLRESLLKNDKTISDYEVQRNLSALKRILRDDNFMERFGITDSMPDLFKELGLIFSDDDLFMYDNPLTKKANNEAMKSVREYQRAGEAFGLLRNSANLDTLFEWLLKSMVK